MQHILEMSLKCSVIFFFHGITSTCLLICTPEDANQSKCQTNEAL